MLLLDEPSSGIAQRETEELGPLLQRIKTETACSILIIEHDMPLISAVADELLALDLGTPVVRGTPAQVLADQQRHRRLPRHRVAEAIQPFRESPMNIKQFQSTFNKLADNINTVIHGKDDVVRLALIAICAQGHVLFEDVPGVGKSMLARAIGDSMHAETSRVQCTPDMLPGDITGSSIIDTGRKDGLRLPPGPVFTNVLLVDEINRATPKTQSALLEAMAEHKSRSTA